MMAHLSGSSAVLLQPEVISETPEWIAVAKPAGWLSVPGQDPASPPVLAVWVRSRYPQAFVVHRLDRETSGVILFAQNADAHRQANRWFEKGDIKKQYHFLATSPDGRGPAPMMRLNQPIHGQASLTQAEVRENLGHAFYGWARPQTGRRHQIRIHLARQGHPLLGDPEYGGPREINLRSGALTIPRVALHAARLELPGGVAFECPLPDDFAGWLACLRAERDRSLPGGRP